MTTNERPEDGETMKIDKAVRAVEIVRIIGGKMQAIDGVVAEYPMIVSVQREEANEEGLPWHRIEVFNAESRAKIVEILAKDIEDDLADLRGLGYTFTGADVLAAYKVWRKSMAGVRVAVT